MRFARAQAVPKRARRDGHPDMSPAAWPGIYWITRGRSRTAARERNTRRACASRRRVDGHGWHHPATHTRWHRGHLICATRGEQGWAGGPVGNSDELSRIRTAELEAAATALGLSAYELWDYTDGNVETSSHVEITERIREKISTMAPAVVVGWGPDGAYGHPDHIAMGRCTDAAVATIPESARPALYHMAVDAALADFYRAAIELNGED